MDSREPTQLGKISTRRAASGRDGRLSVPVCVDTAVLPSGSVTVIGHVVTLTSKIALASFNDMKFPVVPVSALARVVDVFC